MSTLQMILRIPGFLMAISIHEYAHARVAYRLGDDTAARAGRMTLEPWAHIDILGAAMLVMFGFGWARPVPLNPYRLKNPRTDTAKVALAGPLANFVAFLVLQIVVVLLATKIHFRDTRWLYVPNILQEAAFVNAGLGVFNLIPVPPLDGSRIIAPFLPRAMMDVWDNLERYGPILLVILIATNTVSIFMRPVLNLLIRFAQAISAAISMLLFPVKFG